ncbi:laminin subunit alpha-1-like [Anopheles maculipalpis]|uniref:laminin subunit alpha-1-like n=1 Tax=Anopheles maculipalpis TaxID=1496333 RepID=UPI002158A595|nr:laminin subunit alpha-1-like [Anopheles maculipalpis]
MWNLLTKKLGVLILLGTVLFVHCSDSEEELQPYKQFDVVVAEGKRLKLWLDNGQRALCNPVWYFNGRPVAKSHCNSNYGEFVCLAVTRNDAGRYDLWAGDGTRHGQKRLMFSANVQVMREVEHGSYRASEPVVPIVQEAESVERQLQYQLWDDCFCSGVTNRCGMAQNLFWTRSNFTLAKAIPLTTTLLDDETATDYLEIPSYVWNGNLITAYGGYLRFPVTDDCYANRRKPCILMFDRRNRHRAIGYYLPPSHDQRHVQVPMKESSWTVVPTRDERGERVLEDTIDKFIFMSTLSNIQEIYIRGRYRTRNVDNVLSIDMATLFNEGLGQVTTVEECDCHPGYGGLSCEMCEQGYFRVYESISSAGICISFKERWMSLKRRYRLE